MVQEAHRQILRIHGQSELPLPSNAAYFDWGDSPYGGAWHAWQPGCKFDEVIDAIRRPDESENIFICGEAYSALQGWAEGALNTAEQLLTKNIDDPLPGFLEPRTRSLGKPDKSILRVDSKGRRY
jgi:monoamine oxidase